MENGPNIREKIRAVTSNLKVVESSASQPQEGCGRCQGTKLVKIPQRIVDSNNKWLDYRTDCECWYQDNAKAVIDRAPAVIRKVLEQRRIRPGIAMRSFPEMDPEWRPMAIEPCEYVREHGLDMVAQRELLDIVGSNPLCGYYICGNTGVGKSLLLWALAAEAAYAGRKVFISEAATFIEACKMDQFLKPDDERPEGMIYDWDMVTRFYGPTHIYLDEIDNIQPTEFAIRKMFDLLSNCYNRCDKVVFSAASNLTLDKLSGIIGPAAARRIETICEQLNLGV